ncbi:MAG TPA: hypothetical protein VIH90_06115 [Candidatus Saccharimonadales bacterium]
MKFNNRITLIKLVRQFTSDLGFQDRGPGMSLLNAKKLVEDIEAAADISRIAYPVDAQLTSLQIEFITSILSSTDYGVLNHIAKDILNKLNHISY